MTEKRMPKAVKTAVVARLEAGSKDARETGEGLLVQAQACIRSGQLLKGSQHASEAATWLAAAASLRDQALEMGRQ